MFQPQCRDSGSTLGRQHNGEPVHLAVRGRTILIAEPGTGKSWLAGLLCDQLILQGYSLCVIAGYILITYRISALDQAIRETSDAVVMVTRETDHGLAGRVSALEAGTGTRDPRDIAADVAQLIRARYDTAPRLIAAR